MFTKELTHGGHIRRFTVRDAGPCGWEVRIEEDAAVVQRLCYTDWHRVERALSAMALEVETLECNGWREHVAH